MRDAKICEAMMQYNKTLTEPGIYLDQSYEEISNSLYMTQKEYMRYVYNQPDKPWLLYFFQTPGSNIKKSHF